MFQLEGRYESLIHGSNVVGKGGRKEEGDYIRHLMVMSAFASENSKCFVAITRNSGPFSCACVCTTF